MSDNKSGDEEETYCVCRSEVTEDVDDRDWIACDNPRGCPIEWFHIECVGLTKETIPEGEWFCDQCQLSMEELNQGNKSLPLFLCEICEEPFCDKELLLQHKQKHYTLYQKSIKDKSPTDKGQGSGRVADAGSYGDPIPGCSGSRSNSYEDDQARVDTRRQSTSSVECQQRLDTSQREKFTTQSNQSNAEHNDEFTYDMVNLTEEKRQILRHFSDEEIIAEMARRGEAFVCVCGIVFEDRSLYCLHKGCHNTNNPKKCSFCDYEAKDYYDFTSHFFRHNKAKDSIAS